MSAGSACEVHPSEALAGLVERVTFHNAGTGFCVLRVKARGQRDLATVVGHAASISAGEGVHMSGIWVNDRTRGLQLKAAFLKATPPTILEGSRDTSAPGRSAASARHIKDGFRRKRRRATGPQGVARGGSLENTATHCCPSFFCTSIGTK